MFPLRDKPAQGLNVKPMENGMERPAGFFARYTNAAWAKDTSSMISLYHDNVIIFDMWGDKGFSAGLKDWSATIVDWLTSLNDERVRVIFDNIEIEEAEAIAFASALIQYQAIAVDDSVLRSMRNRITLGFLKTDKYWKVKHQHTSAPIDVNLQANLGI